jgi:hypothetical protein
MRGFEVGRGGYVVEPVDLSLQLRYLLSHNKIDVQVRQRDTIAPPSWGIPCIAILARHRIE